MCFFGAKMDQFNKQKLAGLNTRRDVADLLGVDYRRLCYLLYVKKTDRCYIEYSIPKRRGGRRTITAPIPKLRNLQRKLLRVLESVYKVKPSAYGFIKEKGHIENAKNHLSKNLVLNIDLKDFFQQIHFGRVRGLLMSEPYKAGEEAATVMAQIACYKGTLPQGAPTSPILSNMICSSLDTQLTKVAKKYRMVYTRYADDITFSTFKTSFPQEIAYVQNEQIIIGNELKAIFDKNSFIINEEKVYIRGRNRRQEVTGLTVNNRFVNLSRSYLRELRSILFDCQRNGIYESALRYIESGKTTSLKIIRLSKQNITDENEKAKRKGIICDWYAQVLKGKIEYIRCVRGNDCRYFIKYGKAYNEIFGYEAFELPNSLLDIEEKKQKWCFIIEKYDENSLCQGSGFLLKDFGILTNHHVVDDENAIYDIKTDGEVIFSRILGRDFFIKRNESIDYALIKVNGHDGEGWELTEKESIHRNDFVKLICFPNYTTGDSLTEIEAKITSTNKLTFGMRVMTVDKRLDHGASGGIALDNEGKVIGLIVSGTDEFSEERKEQYNPMPGIIPIHRIIEDIKSGD